MALFANREEAAVFLAQRLGTEGINHPLVLAIPRGAVPMGKILADELNGEVDVALVHKIGFPGNPEYALGSVDEHGAVYLTSIAEATGIERYIAEERERQLTVLRRRRAEFTPVRAPINPTGRTVIVVDDGIATGSTMLAALHMVRARKPHRLIAAAAVASSSAVALLREVADEVIALEVSANLGFVGRFFDDFRQVTDAEVVELLRSWSPLGC